MKKYYIEFTQDEIDFANIMFKNSSKNLNKKLSKFNINKNEKEKVSKELNIFYSIVNKFYSVNK